MELAAAVLEQVSTPDVACFLFSSLQSARECIEFSTSPRRGNGVDRQPVPPEKITVRAFTAKDLFYAVICPSDQQAIVAGFWSTAGVGGSSRFAEVNLKHLNQLTELSLMPGAQDGQSHQVLRESIVFQLERAPLRPMRQPRPFTQDVYLFPSGMASIYKLHTYMLGRVHGTTVLFGMAFIKTLTTLTDFGPGYKFFGHGPAQDLHDLETFLVEEQSQGRKVQAIWTEFPANPLLDTPNIQKLRDLADEYELMLGIDDTIGS